MKNYKKYIQSLHTHQTSDEIIESIVQEGTGEKLVKKKRLAIGEASEVYDITLPKNHHVILRISKKPHEFEQEKWAIDRCSKIGIPAPQILLTKYDPELKLSFNIQEKLPGSPLQYGEIDFRNIPEHDRRTIINQAGSILSKIHSIPTTGIGWINGKGVAEHKNSDEILDHFEKNSDYLFELATQAEISEQDIHKALKLFQTYKPAYASIHPVLNHGDFGDKHIFVEGTHITGIIDWGMIRSDVPEYDFANWDFWFGSFIPTEWLKEGYENKQIFSSLFDELISIIKLTKGIEIMYWYTEKNYPDMVKEAGKKFKKALHFFQ